jgi:hypothetical protein
MRIQGTALGGLQFVRRRGQAHPGTFLPPAHCAADTIRWLLQLRPKPKGEFERIRCSLLQSRPEAAARFFPLNELNGPAVDLLKTPVDLLSPSFFPGGVDRLIQAAN